MKSRRERLNTINDMLEVISNNKNIGSTNITKKANLYTNGWGGYKKELIKKGFIKEIILPKGNVKGRYHKKESKTFEITNKGREYLKFYKKLTDFKEKFGLNKE